jgi:hypothetical protein
MGDIEHGEGLQGAVDALADAYTQRAGGWDYERRVVEAMATQDAEISRLTKQLRGAVDRIEDLEGALAWALAYIDRPGDVSAEEQENYDGAERVLDAEGRKS